jgi:hypothetical protein
MPATEDNSPSASICVSGLMASICLLQAMIVSDEKNMMNDFFIL